MEIRILGPVEVLAGGQVVPVGGARTRAVLAMLALRANKVVPAELIADQLWPGLDTGRALANLRVRVAELRRALRAAGETDRVVTWPPGYVLRATNGELDAARFAELAGQGRVLLAMGDAAGACGRLDVALGLWRGRPLADLGEVEWARGQVAQLEEDRLAAVECRAQARLECGEAGGLTGELEVLTAEYPLRERLWALRMLALYRCGRQAEALAAYQRLRATLVQELGIEPGAELRDLHRQILAQDPALDGAAAATAAGAATPAGPDSGPVVVPHELPGDVEAFTGRGLELAELDFLLPAAAEDEPGRLSGPVVISAVAGTAGVGKTALAVHWAHRAAGQFPDGQLYVNLRGYDPRQPVTPSDALAGFLRALGVAGAEIPLAEAERAARYRSLVADKRMLVVLDNAATEEQVRPLLPGTGTAMVVVTSRDSLAGLVAVDGAHRLDLDLLPPGEAVALLCTLIGARADAEPTAAEALALLCARLPLALRVAAELAVARPQAPLAGLVAELAGEGDRLQLLDAGGDPRGAVAAVFSWSYQHLPADAAQMFRLLGLHPAQHWDEYAAAALAATGSLAQARRPLGVLARAHLIQAVDTGRYQMHDLLRAYAAGLAARHEGEHDSRAALTGLFDYYLATSAAAMDRFAPAERHQRPDPPRPGTPLPHHADLAAARAWLDAELTTLAQVAAHAASHGWPSHTTRLAATLYRYLYGSHDTEALTVHTHALNAARHLGDRAAEAHMLANLGYTHDRQGRYQQATDCHRQALALACDTGDRYAQARAVAGLAIALHKQGHYQLAIDGYQQALASFRELGDLAGQARQLQNLSCVCSWQGEYGQAADYAEQSLLLAREIDERKAMASALGSLGEACYHLGRYSQADDCLRQAIELARETGYKIAEADALAVLGKIWHNRGDYDQAAGHHQQALALCREIGNPSVEADALNGMGQTLLATGHPDQARDSHTAALTVVGQTGDRYQQARALTGLGDVSYWRGDHDQAFGYYQQTLALCQESGDPSGEADALNGMGQTLLATGHPDQARDCHTTALTLAGRTGERYQQARAHRGLADAWTATGDPSQADQHRRHALGIYRDLGVPEAARIQTSPGPRAHLTENPAGTP